MKKNYLKFNRSGILTSLLMFLILGSRVLAQQSFTFTNASATGSAGPTQAMINTAYNGSNLQGSVIVNPQGMQNFTIPVTGPYKIEAWGGQGYGPFGGRGAYISGEFTLNAGSVLKILVGQQGGAPLTGNNQYGGGGGSFIATSNNVPLVVAGGGGGSWATSYQANTDGTVSTSGNPGLNGAGGNGAGGTNGSGGQTGSFAEGGAGFYGNGSGSTGPAM
jgi:hypothetical protein